MATLANLRDSVARDLRDPNMVTFIAATIDDLINSGIDEVSRLRPREVVDSIPVVAGTYEYATDCEDAFRLELWRSGRHYQLVPRSEDETQSGWDIFGGLIHVPVGLIDHASPSTDVMRVWGYAPFTQLGSDDDAVSDLDTSGEWAMRRYARATAFQLMHADRALFKQWQAASQNSDVSPNQLNQMLALYQSEWDRARNYLRRIRRV